MATEFHVSTDYILGLEQKKQMERHIPMRLMSTSFKPGECLMLVNQLEDPASREMAYCEYYYFTGQHDKAVNLTVLYLNHPDPMLQLSACLIHTFANLSLNRINAAKGGLRNLKIHLNQMIADNSDRRTTAMSIFVAMAAQTLLHLPIGKIPPLSNCQRACGSGAAMFLPMKLTWLRNMRNPWVLCRPA